MNRVLETHCIDAAALRADDFDGFYASRKERLLSVVEAVMGKAIDRDELADEVEDDD